MASEATKLESDEERVTLPQTVPVSPESFHVGRTVPPSNGAELVRRNLLIVVAD
jgi:hypothetical protein